MPKPAKQIPNPSRSDGCSWRKATANGTTGTRLNLSTGATLAASSIFNARKQHIREAPVASLETVRNHPVRAGS